MHMNVKMKIGRHAVLTTEIFYIGMHTRTISLEKYCEADLVRLISSYLLCNAVNFAANWSSVARRRRTKNIYLLNNNSVVNIGDKNFAEVQFRWNFVEVKMNANIVIPENLVALH